MIIQRKYKEFAKELDKKKSGVFPVSAQVELTYRCPFDCIHCYSKNIHQRELTTEQWKKIFDELFSAGTIYLTITGGDPFVRDDFWDLYSYVKAKGFLVTLFSSGYLFDDEVIAGLKKNLPVLVEITLNSLKCDKFDKISGVPGSFVQVKENIENCINNNIPLVLKTIGMTENKDEILDIKEYICSLLGPGKFKFDSFLIPRLDGDTGVCKYRLNAEDIADIENSDPDMLAQRQKEFAEHKNLMRDSVYKYHCNSWFRQAYITPSGYLRFCHLSDKFSYDLKEYKFADVFYGRVAEILEQKHEQNFKCLECELKEFCNYCPARAFLETGSEEKPVEYYCELALTRKERHEKIKNL